MNTQTSTIARNWKSTFAYLGGGVVAAGLSAVLFATIVEGAITFGIALIPAITAIILLFMAKGGAADAICPRCGEKLSGLSTGNNQGVLCEKCLQFFEGKDGKLWATDPECVADSALFGTILPSKFEWPDGCCVCGQPATHSEKVTTRVQSTGSAISVIGVSAMTGGAVGGTAGGTRYTLEVPHCDAHKDGAMLSPQGDDKLKVRFRSYPFLRSFCERNDTRPA